MKERKITISVTDKTQSFKTKGLSLIEILGLLKAYQGLIIKKINEEMESTKDDRDQSHK